MQIIRTRLSESTASMEAHETPFHRVFARAVPNKAGFGSATPINSQFFEARMASM